MSQQVEVSSQLVGCSLDVVLLAWLVEKQTQTKGSLSLSTSDGVHVSKVKHLREVLNGLSSVASFAFDLGETLVGTAELIIVLGLNANFEEPVQIVNSIVHFTERFVNICDLLVALSLLVGVLDLICHVKALSEEVQSGGGVAILLVLNSDGLVDADEILGDFDSNGVEVSFCGFFKSGFKVFFSLRSIVYFLLADTETLQGKRLALEELELIGNVETPFVEVTCGFKIIELLEIVRHSEVSFKTLFNFSFPLVRLTVDEGVFQSG